MPPFPVDETTRRRMQAVGRTNTRPEMLVKQALRKAGLRYRAGQGRHRPNSADIILPQAKCALFVHGCFWHGHAGCARATLPATRSGYWADKIARTQTRDKNALRDFVARGWLPVVLWECDIRNPQKLERSVRRLKARLEKRNG